jgi:CRISP-associated protein Cas1
MSLILQHNKLKPSTRTNSSERSSQSAWAIRCAMWQKRLKKPPFWRAKRKPVTAPLILAGHGVSLKIEAGTLVVKNGFTHYPQEQEAYRFFKRDPELPSRIIMLDGSGTLSFDALTWLAEQKVPLVRIDWTGAVVVVSSFAGFADDQERVAWQLATRNDTAARMKFCNALIARKIEGCIATLEQSMYPSDARDKAMDRAYADLATLTYQPPRDTASLLVLEANSAAAYFRAWQKIPIKWKSSAHHPIPNEWRIFGPRSSRLVADGNRNASHPVNAMLNYAYAVLQSQSQIQAVADGYDPNLGVMHVDREYGPAFVFDLMEPERPKVDRAIVEFLKSETLHAADFVIRTDGVVRLNPQLARHIASTVLAVYS